MTGLPPTAPGAVITATATGPLGDTSEFSRDFAGNTPPAVSIVGPVAATTAGTPVVLSGKVSDPDAGETYTFAWGVTDPTDPSFSLPADTVTGEPTFRFTPTRPGNYLVQLTVTDSQGGSGTASNALTARAAGPAVLILGTPIAPAAGSPVSLSSTVHEPAGAATVSYAWGVTEDGVTYNLPPGTATDGPAFTFVPATRGAYVVTLTVTDDAGGKGVGTTVFVAGAAAGVSITGAPTSGLEGLPISLVAQTTGSVLSGPYTFAWNVTRGGTPFGQGQSGASNVFRFTPDLAGSYAVTVTATDSKGVAATSPPTVIRVAQAPPRVAIQGAPRSAATYAPYTLNAAPTDGGTGPLAFSWSVYNTGLGRVTATGTGATFTESPQAAGVDVVTLSASRVDVATGKPYGAAGLAEVSVPVSVSPEALSVVPPPGPLLEGTPAAFGVRFGQSGGGPAFGFSWTVTGRGNPFSAAGTGSSGDPTPFSFTPPYPGDYLVSVSAAVAGSPEVASRVFHVANVAPTPSIAGLPAGPIDEGTSVALTGSASDPGGRNDPLRMVWTVTGPDGFSRKGTSPSLAFRPVEAGAYVVTLAVTDSSGATATSGGRIVVSPVLPPPVIQSAAGLVNLNTTHTVSLTTVYPDPGADDALVYLWQAFLGGTVVASQATTSPDFTFGAPDSGTYRVSLTVSGDDGTSATTTADLVLVTSPGTTTLDPSAFATGDQVVVLATAAGAKVDATGLTTSLDAIALGGHDTLVGGGGPNVLQGDSGFNTLVGGVGPNTLYGTANDTLFGGNGGNTNLFQLTPGVGEAVTAGAAGNTLSFADTSSGVTVNLNDNGGAPQPVSPGSTLSLSGAFQN
ncbi:MAG: PKD domain-containing protein, partial [Actinobacteria bacterium]|nr:PKD domain-containing protein [Actinomycetota bacterium]